MSVLKRYIEYIKNNLERYWFKRKIYGWGWTPATWEGWLVLFIYIALFVAIFMRVDFNSHSASDTLLSVFLPELLLIVTLIGVCYWKGEKPRWQWGFDDSGKNDSL